MLWQARKGLIAGRAALDASAAVYQGPGDVTGWGTAYGYWGLRAYNSTKIGANCIDVCPNQTGASGTVTTLVIGANGYVDASAIGYSPIYINKLYDQAAGSGTAQHFLYVAGNRPELVPSMVGGKPAMLFPNSYPLLTSANAVAQAQPLSVGVILRADAAGNGVFTDGTFGFNPFVGFSSGNMGQNFGVYTQNYTGAAALNAFASYVSIASSTPTASGGSSTMSINGAAPVTSPGGVGPNGIGSTNKLTIGAGTDSGGGLLSGYIYEVIVKAGMVSAADQTALSTNQHLIGTGW